MKEKDVCPKCGGAGFVYADDDTVTQCVCRYRKLLKTYLGPLADAKVPKDSPLWGETHDETGNNLLIEAPWNLARCHLKWALGCKGPDFSYRLISDQRIVRVYVGDEDTINIRDLVDPVNIKLLIIRLGVLRYKNVAAAGALHEVLLMREMEGSPTWVVDDPNHPLRMGHLMWSQEVLDYIHRRFAVVNLAPEIVRPPPQAERVDDEKNDEDVGVEAHGDSDLDRFAAQAMPSDKKKKNKKSTDPAGL